ncbi:MAG: lysoplasmalogenase [Lachnospiraceae bacterium]|nr:lysoplasmalogenase [Lachnospiraceae bacterium]
MQNVILLLYFIVSLIHLIDSYRDDRKRRAKTKPFLLVFLLVYYLIAAAKPSLFLVLALFASWLGDVLLIFPGHRWFTLGGISFIFSHIFFILVYVRNFEISQVPWAIIIPAAFLYCGIALWIIHLTAPTTPKRMVGPMRFYLFCNSMMNLFALLQMLSLKSEASVVAYIGAVLFFISDCTLFLVRYYKHPNVVFKKHFTVMATYLVGEFLIVMGVLGIHAGV